MKDSRVRPVEPSIHTLEEYVIGRKSAPGPSPTPLSALGDRGRLGPTQCSLAVPSGVSGRCPGYLIAHPMVTKPLRRLLRC